MIKFSLSASKNVCMVNIADKTHKTSDKNKKSETYFSDKSALYVNRSIIGNLLLYAGKTNPIFNITPYKNPF